jgi:DNA repair photolyase
MKNFIGKAIYNPSGKAGEYSYWACNFYNGCSNGCTYCYLKKGVLAHTLGGDKPTLKKCFKDEANALEIFEKELKANLPELKKCGLFFSFTTDPLLKETCSLTYSAMSICLDNNVPIKTLTKRAEFIREIEFDMCYPKLFLNKYKKLITWGFTLTGLDEEEPNASTNAERIEAMRKLHDAGFKTWASIEPVIDFRHSEHMVYQTLDFCNLYKIGLESGRKYDKMHLDMFVKQVVNAIYGNTVKPKIYFKDSLLKQAGIKREDLPANCVKRDYNMFNN